MNPPTLFDASAIRGTGAAAPLLANVLGASTEYSSIGKDLDAEGTGLGLHLSQKLAGLIGAEISFDSEFGKGSSFVPTLRDR